MFKKIIACALAVVLITMACSCSIIGGSNTEEEQTAPQSMLTQEEWEASVADLKPEEMQGVTAQIISQWQEAYTTWVAYPQIDGQESASQELADFAQEEIGDFQTEVAAADVPFADLTERPGIQVTYKPYKCGEATYSFKFSTYTNSGVAKTINAIQTFVYDQQSGERLALEELFAEDADYLGLLSECVREELKTNAALSENMDEELFLAGTDALEENFSEFVVGENNLIFYFNQGQIALPSAGNFEASVSFEKLSDVLNENLAEGKALTAVAQNGAASDGELPEYLTSKGGNYMSAFSIDGIDPQNDKVIALTFDDGPSGKYTQQILNALKENGGKATFFELGQNAEEYPEVVQAVYDAGCEIGNHSYNHTDYYKISMDEVISDQISKTNDIIEGIVGKRPIIFRAPYGNVTQDMAMQVGRPSIYWTIDSEDWKNKDEDLNYQTVMNNAYDGAIVLMHDIYEPTADAAVRIIEDLTDQGYKLVTITQLIQIMDARGQELTWRIGRDSKIKEDGSAR